MRSVILNLGRGAIASLFPNGVITAALLFSSMACQSLNSTPLPDATPQPTASSRIESTPSKTAESSLSSDKPSPSAQVAPLATAKLSTNGLGPIKIGMTVKEASDAAGVPLVALNGGVPDLKASCFYVKPKSGPEGLDFMLSQGRIVRIDLKNTVSQEVNGRPVNRDVTAEVSQITTSSGAKIGDTEAQLKAIYPTQLEVTGHKYAPGGHYLTFVPQDVQDQNFRLIFETDGKRVVYIRSGRLPEVQWVERCG